MFWELYSSFYLLYDIGYSIKEHVFWELYSSFYLLYDIGYSIQEHVFLLLNI